MKALNIARETGLSRLIGQPHEFLEKKKLRQEAVMLEDLLVIPH